MFEKCPHLNYQHKDLGGFKGHVLLQEKDCVTVRREQQAIITTRSTIIGFCQFQKTTTEILS